MIADRKIISDEWKPLDLDPIRARVFHVSMICIAAVLAADLLSDGLRHREWTEQIIWDIAELAFLFILALAVRKRRWSWIPAFLMVSVTVANVLVTSGSSDVLIILDLFFITGLAVIQAFLVGVWALHLTMTTGVAVLLFVSFSNSGDLAANRMVLIAFFIGLNIILTVFTRTLQSLSKQSTKQWEALLETRDSMENRERLKLVNQLILGLAHNINTPLGNARMRASVLADTGNDDPEVITGIQADLADVNNVLKELHRFSVLDSEDEPQRLAAEALHDLICDALESQGRKALCDGITVAGPDIVTRSLAVLQAILILVENAHLYGRDADGRFSLTIRTEADSHGFRIEVKDGGRGIPEELRNDIFQPYFRLGTAGRGRGMGLSIARQICRYRLGGSIAYEPADNRFIITLPRHIPPKAGSPGSAGAESISPAEQ